jgi:hypothetical protein
LKPRSFAYVRLSRADLKQPGSLDEKFKLRAVICQRLAEQYGLSLLPEDITLEQGSGGKLATRPGMLALLEKVRTGECRHLVTPYVDRLLRGDKRDEQEIEDTLCNAGVPVYHTEGDPIRFGADYDPLMFEVKSLVARQELRGVIKKRRETDLARLELGKRSRSQAPYGYLYLKPVYDAYGQRVTAEGYETVPDQLDRVREAWQRVQREPLRAICADFNARGIPPPGSGRRANAAALWRPESLRAILLNPFYAGFLNQRVRQVRGRRVELDPDDYVLAKQPGDWETVGDLAEWRRIVETLRRRHRAGPARRGVLTGILYAACGSKMVVTTAHFYGCLCGDKIRAPGRPRHPGHTLALRRVEAFAAGIVAEVLARLDASALGAWKQETRPRSETAGERRAAVQQLASKKRTAQDMMTRRDEFIETFGEENYREAAAKVRADLEELKARLLELEKEAASPDLSESLPLLLKVRALGVARLWAAGSREDVAAVAASIIRRIDLLPVEQQPTRAYTARVSVTLWDWVRATGYEPPGTLPDGRHGERTR